MITQFFDWLDLHNGAVTAIATTALTVITVVYVVFTSRLVAEQRRDRTIAYTPNLLWNLEAIDPAKSHVEYTVVNNSHAAASYIIICVVGRNGAWCRSDAFSLAPGDTAPEKQVPGHAAPPNPRAQLQGGSAPSAIDILGATAATGHAAFCQNALGHVVRIRPQTTRVDVWMPSPSLWRRFEHKKPAWVFWYEQQIAELVKL